MNIFTCYIYIIFISSLLLSGKGWSENVFGVDIFRTASMSPSDTGVNENNNQSTPLLQSPDDGHVTNEEVVAKDAYFCSELVAAALRVRHHYFDCTVHQY